MLKLIQVWVPVLQKRFFLTNAVYYIDRHLPSVLLCNNLSALTLT